MDARVRADVATLWQYHRIDDDLRAADVVIGLGSHDPGVAVHAADVYRRGFAPLVVFSGARTARTRDVFPRGEAVHLREIALRYGVPDAAVLVESRARDTGENLTRTRELLARRGVAPAVAILVCRPYQQRRARATAGAQWPGLDVECTALPQTFDEHVAAVGGGARDADAVVAMLVGDTQRVVEYPARGFAVAQHVPGAVHDAFARLVAAGYTARLLPRDGGG